MRANGTFLGTGTVALLLAVTLLSGLVTANSPPVAKAGSDQTVKVGALVRFGASDSYDPDQDPLAYKWDFDDANGIQVESTLVAPTHTYDKPGKYAVTLTVFDGTVNSSTIINITVMPDLPPRVDLGPDFNAEVNEWIYFDPRNVTDPNGDPMTFKWDFDASNGISVDSTDRMPEWKYVRPGTYKVTLTISDGKYTVNDTANVTVAYNHVMVGGKSFSETRSLRAGQKVAYSISLTSGRGLEVKITSKNNTLLSAYLFQSQNYYKYSTSGEVVAIKQGSKQNSTKISYSVQVSKTDDYYIMVMNPSADNQVVATYSISIKSVEVGPGFIPGPSPVELVPAFILTAMAAALIGRRQKGQ